MRKSPSERLEGISFVHAERACERREADAADRPGPLVLAYAGAEETLDAVAEILAFNDEIAGFGEARREVTDAAFVVGVSQNDQGALLRR